MKHAVLTSIGHNIADSLASGIGMMIGVYEMDVFGEAARSDARFMEVDFLTGSTVGAKPSDTLVYAIRRYVEVLPSLCERQGALVSDFEKLVAHYDGRSPRRHDFTVEVVDRSGRRSVDRYSGLPGSRPKTLDALGRVRTVKSA